MCFGQDYDEAKRRVTDMLAKHAVVRSIAMDPKQVGVEVVPFEIANIAGEFDSALEALQAKCRLMEQIQAATEKMGQ